jgi:hypothetical protein
MPRRSNLIGKTYGDLTVLEYCDTNKYKMARFLVQCKCGKTKIVLGQNLKTGATKSCGHHKRRHVMYRGERMTLTDAVKKNGTTVPVRTVKARIHRNWPVEEAVETPSRSHRHYHGRGNHRSNRTGFMGVRQSKWKNGFDAKISIQNKSKYLGWFATAQEAHQAYVNAARERQHK